MRFDDLNELLHAIRMQALGATYADDRGDEDDGDSHPDAWIKVALAGRRFIIGRTRIFYAAVELPPMPEHDPGDEQPRLVVDTRLYADLI